MGFGIKYLNRTSAKHTSLLWLPGRFPDQTQSECDTLQKTFNSGFLLERPKPSKWISNSTKKQVMHKLDDSRNPTTDFID